MAPGSGATGSLRNRKRGHSPGALEAGVNFFHTADAYSLGGSEELLENVRRTIGADRETLVIATNVLHEMSDDAKDRGLTCKHILRSIDRSIKRLRHVSTDWVIC